jgi:hypothetical protein
MHTDTHTSVSDWDSAGKFLPSFLPASFSDSGVLRVDPEALDRESVSSIFRRCVPVHILVSAPAAVAWPHEIHFFRSLVDAAVGIMGIAHV